MAHELKQDGDDTVFYVIELHDGLIVKGHTCYNGHCVKSPVEFLLATSERDEWEAWGSEGSADDEPSEDPPSEGSSSQEI